MAWAGERDFWANAGRHKHKVNKAISAGFTSATIPPPQAGASVVKSADLRLCECAVAVVRVSEFGLDGNSGDGA